MARKLYHVVGSVTLDIDREVWASDETTARENAAEAELNGGGADLSDLTAESIDSDDFDGDDEEAEDIDDEEE